MPAHSVHPSETAGDVVDLIADLRVTAKNLADVLREREGGGAELDVERYVRLAEYALSHAYTHATTGTETSAPMFGFQFVALALLEPDDGDRYYTEGEFESLAFDAIRAITEFVR